MDTINLPELDDLANEVGDFICYWGFKKIHGRLWTHIYLSTEPLDASQLMARLKVSKALISLSLHDLLRHEVIKEGAKSARGTQTYQANPNILDVILNVLRKRERKMLNKAETSHKTLSGVGPDKLGRAHLNNGRIDALGQMIGQAQAALSSLLELGPMDLSGFQELNQEKQA